MSAACPEYGFVLSVRLAAGLTAGARGALWDALVAALEARGLSASGVDGPLEYYVISRDGGQAIDADREALRAWAAARPEIAEVVVGPLIDLHEAAT